MAASWASIIGPSNHTIDLDGRIIIPQRMRDWLGQRFVVTRGIEKCLWLLPEGVFDRITSQWSDPLSLLDRGSRMLDWRFVGQAVRVQPDKQFRIVIPQELKQSAALTNELIILGMPNRVEVWDLDTWRQHEAALSEAEVQSALDAKLKPPAPPAEQAA